MEKVIFICLLLISMSLSLPNPDGDEEETNSVPPSVPETKLDATETTINTVEKDESATQTTSSDATVAPKADNIMEVPSSEKAEPGAPIVPTTVASTVKPDDKGAMKPLCKIVDTCPTLQSRFDGSSFMGGIILTLGVFAVSFLGFKCYKMKYHIR